MLLPTFAELATLIPIVIVVMGLTSQMVPRLYTEGRVVLSKPFGKWLSPSLMAAYHLHKLKSQVGTPLGL